jgi:uncharacterized protein (TIGR01244 family)
MGDPVGILNWQRIDHRITTSGQPGEAELAAIRALGVTDIINLGLHSHEKALPDEAASVAALGMRYHHLPVAFDHPTDDDFAAFCALMAELGDTPVHVHCIVNARVSAFFYRYRRDVLGVDEAKARAAMEALWTPSGVWEKFVAPR